jgi:hypothetical protein
VSSTQAEKELLTAEDAKKNRGVRKAVRAVNLLAEKNIKVE